MSACEKCRMDYAERNPPDPPCESCRVELVEENADAAKVYMTVRSQVLMRTRFTEHGMPYSEPYDLNHLAIWAAIDGYGIRDRAGVFEKVCRTWHTIQRERRDDGGD